MVIIPVKCARIQEEILARCGDKVNGRHTNLGDCISAFDELLELKSRELFLHNLIIVTKSKH